METEPTSVPKTEGLAPGPLTVGERVEGHLAEMGAGVARLALADGRSVSMDPAEVAGAGSPDLAELISAFVVRIDPGGEVWVSRTKGSAALQLLLNARDHDLTVEGRVMAQGPRGLEIDLGGGVYAVCPPDEIGDDVDNPGHLVGETIAFKVKEATEVQVVLSRRALVSAAGARAGGETQAEEAAEVRRRLRPGAVMAGRVSRIREFGAFVDLGGGVEGLIHLSELAHERIASPKDVVQPGQAVEVQVLKLDYDAHKGERISLSLKALTKSTWDKLSSELKEGTQLTGRVTRIEPFGAFVELAPGVSGLIHVSAMGGRRHAPAEELVKADDQVQVQVLSIDPEKRRISLKRVPGEAEVAERRAAQAALREQKKAEAREKREEARKKPHERLKPGDVVDGVVDRIEPYGFFLQLKGGGRGMVHVSEIGSPPEGVDPQKPPSEQFPKGTKIKVAVLEIDPEHRIRLSRAAVPDLESGTTAESYLRHKTQHELEEKLLRSAAKPVRPKGPAAVRRRPEGRPSAGAPSTAPKVATADRPQRRERPGNQRPAALKPEKSGGLGTLGDLLKMKLQQRKS